MSKKIKELAAQIQKAQRKLLKACLDGDEARIIKHQHKLLKLNLKEGARD